jgi:hypothetical protein
MVMLRVVFRAIVFKNRDANVKYQLQPDIKRGESRVRSAVMVMVMVTLPGG